MTDRFEIIGHVPARVATWLNKSLNRPTNCGKVIIKGKRINRRGDYGFEVPCEYLFEGDSFSFGWLQAKLIKEESLDVRVDGT